MMNSSLCSADVIVSIVATAKLYIRWMRGSSLTTTESSKHSYGFNKPFITVKSVVAAIDLIWVSCFL